MTATGVRCSLGSERHRKAFETARAEIDQLEQPDCEPTSLRFAWLIASTTRRRERGQPCGGFGVSPTTASWGTAMRSLLPTFLDAVMGLSRSVSGGRLSLRVMM
jgi:hypothetical protein